jgi:cytochrome c1
MNYGCGSCHRIPGVAGAEALVGPPLDDYHARSYIAGTLPNTLENLVLWIREPQAVEANTAMPNLGVSAEEAQHMAAYLYDQPHTFRFVYGIYGFD